MLLLAVTLALALLFSPSSTQLSPLTSLDLSTQAMRSLLGGNGSGTEDGMGTQARFSSPNAIAVSASGDFAIISDRNNHKLRKIYLANVSVSTLCGSGIRGYRDGNCEDAQMDHPQGLALSKASSFVCCVIH
jgi:hypothetical protein